MNDTTEILDNVARSFICGTIGTAVDHMRRSGKVARAGWNGKGMWLALQVPDAGSKMTEPYVYMKTAQGGLIPWLCSQADMLASDWQSVE